MSFEPYGGQIWSGEPAPASNPVQQQMLSLGGVGLGVSGLLFAGSRIGNNSWNPIDSVIQATSLAGDMSPFGLGNTFRIPEFLSPFGSPAQQELSGGLGHLSSGKLGFSWDQDYLKSRDTQLYLQEAFGLSPQQLEDAGISSGMIGEESKLAKELIFERTAGSPKGELYTIVGNERRALTSNVSMMKMVRDSPDFLDKERAVNRAAFGVFQSLNMWKHEGFDADAVFRTKGMSHEQMKLEDITPNRWMPVPSISGSIESPGDLLRRTALPRAVPAFEIERFNRLASGFVHQTLGETGEDAFKKLTGMGLETMPGPASNTFMRLGGRAALAMAGIGAVSQGDWVRRNYGVSGEVVASATLSGAIGYGVNKLGGSPKTAMFAAAASFFGQVVLPGFEEGVIPGIATSYARANTLRASAANPVNYYRRTLEGYFPGITDWKTGAAVGIGVAMGTSMRVPFVKERLPQYLMDHFGAQKFGLPGGAKTPDSARDLFWKGVQKDGMINSKINMDRFNGAKGVFDRARLGGTLAWKVAKDKEFGGATNLMGRLNSIWDSAEEQHRNNAKANPINDALIDRLKEVNSKYTDNDFLSRLKKEASGFGAQTYYSFFGADASERETSKAIKGMGFGRMPLPDVSDIAKEIGISGLPKDLPISPTGKLGRIMSVGLAAFGMHQLATGGLLGSMQTSGELEDIYSGKQLVEVKKSRWWEGGGTPFEGGQTTYFRPHAYHLMMNRTREKGIWGADEDSISPLRKFFTKNFTYDLEMANYYDRPYPISSAAFAEVPIIGGILSNTIGRLFKPPKLMHVDEWMREGQSGNLEYASTHEGWKREPSYALGAPKPGIPGSPFTPEFQASFLSYQFRELEGMTGWAKNLLSDAIAGSDVYGTDTPVLADAGMMTSPRLRFWETNQGGAFFSNEAIRRILPRYRSEIERQNPIMNSMPTWLPDRFRRGDPYRSVEWGEARLPGEGYADLHPELKGLDPQDYPLIFQYSILADVAPFSKEFRQTQIATYKQRAAQLTNSAENAYLDQIDQQVAERYNMYEFDRVHENALELPGSSLTQSFTAAARSALRKTAAPAEYLVPMGFRPVQKLLGSDRDPIERYEFERMYGTQFAFWDKPWRDWFRPALYSAANLVGYEGKPAWRQEADANAAYFDKLEFAKWMKLANEAEANGDGRLKQRYLFQASNTRSGVNPQGNPLSIYWTLPQQDRAFFNAFSQAQGADRDRILEMVPEDQVHLYQAVWSRADAGDPKMFPGSAASVDQAYLTQQFYGLEDYFRIEPEPPDDWIGWHEDVDIGDIKVKYIDKIGQDLHDHGAWESQLKQAQAQSYLEGSTAFLPTNGGVGRGVIQSELRRRLPASTTVHTNTSIDSRSKINYNDDRVEAIRYGLGSYLGGY